MKNVKIKTINKEVPEWQESIAVKGGMDMMPGYMKECLIPYISFLIAQTRNRTLDEQKVYIDAHVAYVTATLDGEKPESAYQILDSTIKSLKS